MSDLNLHTIFKTNLINSLNYKQPVLRSMDYSSFTEIFGMLYQVSFELKRTDNGFYLSSLFCLEKYIANPCVNLVVNDEVIYMLPINFLGEVGIYKWYSISAYLLSNDYIRNIILSIKNEYGLEVGSWNIYENIFLNYGIIGIYQSFYYLSYFFILIFLNSLDVSCGSDAQSLSTTTPSTAALFYPSPLSETLISPAVSPNPNTNLSCINCGVKETPLWRRKRMERYCNACCL